MLFPRYSNVARLPVGHVKCSPTHKHGISPHRPHQQHLVPQMDPLPSSALSVCARACDLCVVLCVGLSGPVHVIIYLFIYLFTLSPSFFRPDHCQEDPDHRLAPAGGCLPQLGGAGCSAHLCG